MGGLTMKAIIAAVDGSDRSMRAVGWAAEEAARRGLPLRIVHALTPWLYGDPVDPRLGVVRDWMLANGREVVDQAVAAAREREPGVAADGETMPGPAAEVLLDAARDAAMIVLGGRGTGRVTDLLLGSTALQIVSHTPVPAVVVREAASPGAAEVALGMDGSPAGERAVGFAFEEASLRAAPLRAIRVWSHPASAGPGDIQPPVYDPEVVAEEELRRLEGSVAAWRAKHPDVEVVPEVVRGRPAKVLADASARSVLLVVGTRGRGGFAGLLLGSVSHALLHHAQCPLAVVPP
jgi:nucleotide-binding universal stress UspA family protein